MERAFKGIWIPKEIWLDENLNWVEKILLVEIVSLDNKQGCWASNAYFADFFKLSKNRISVLINSLKEKGYITIELQYKKGTKQIEKRIIRNKYTYMRKQIEGITENTHTPICENAKDNNTSLNNTINNTKDIIPDESGNAQKGKMKKEKAVKEKYGEFENVLLTKEEHQKLLDRFPSDLKPRIEKLSVYVASTGKTYKSHYATINMWAKKDEPKQRSRGYDTSEYENFF